MRVFRTVEELEEYLKQNNIVYKRIVPNEEYFWVEGEKRIMKFYKPRPAHLVLSVMRNNYFPGRYLRLIETKTIKLNHPAMEAVKVLKGRGALLEGPTGTGKTTACVWKIFQYTRLLICKAPMYIPCMGPNTLAELYQDIQDADCYLLDDLNPITLERQQFRHFVYDVVYHAYERNKKLFITTNSKLDKFLEEPALRRISEMCVRVVVK